MNTRKEIGKRQTQLKENKKPKGIIVNHNIIITTTHKENIQITLNTYRYTDIKQMRS